MLPALFWQMAKAKQAAIQEGSPGTKKQTTTKKQ